MAYCRKFKEKRPFASFSLDNSKKNLMLKGVDADGNRMSTFGSRHLIDSVYRKHPAFTGIYVDKNTVLEAPDEADKSD